MLSAPFISALVQLFDQFISSDWASGIHTPRGAVSFSKIGQFGSESTSLLKHPAINSINEFSEAGNESLVTKLEVHCTVTEQKHTCTFEDEEAISIRIKLEMPSPVSEDQAGHAQGLSCTGTADSSLHPP